MKTTITRAERVSLAALLTQSAEQGREQDDVLDRVFVLLGATSAERRIPAVASLRPDGQDADRLLSLFGISVEGVI